MCIIRITFKSKIGLPTKTIECDERQALEKAAAICLKGYTIDKSEMMCIVKINSHLST